MREELREKLYATFPHWFVVARMRQQDKEAMAILRANSGPVLKVKPRLTESMEIAFYNVIDHRCDKWEQTDAPAESICKNISDYTERFIAGHVMSERKEAELRRFTQSIIEIINS